MPLPVFDSAEQVPEAFRPEYEEREGKWHPKSAVGQDVTKLAADLETQKRKAAQLLDEKKQAERERDALKLAKDATDKGVTEETVTRLKEEIGKPLIADRDAAAAERDAAKAELRQVKLTDRVRSLWLKYGGFGEREEDAMDALAKRTDLDADGGIVVKKKDGSPSAETIDDFLKTTFKKEKPWLFIGNGSSGSGAGGSNGNGADDSVPAPTKDTIAAKRTQVAGSF